ncbi:hypothetical protein BD309DRAFT_893052 [Dichomitus squalens]|nr:hypothetical protein BD309DRAFT_893052 [Dichomitus squalens]
MQEAKVPLMLSLGCALKLLLGGSMSAPQRSRGAQLLFSYLQEFKRIYGLEAMVPNHHFATHIPQQLEEFGTVYEIWAFLAERLNKTLKSTNQNNRRGGQQEVIMMREFDRHMQVRAIVEHVSTLPADGTNEVDVSRSIAQRFFHDSREARGTVEAMGSRQDCETAVQHDVFLGADIGVGIRSARTVQLNKPLCDVVLRWYTQNPTSAPRHRLFHAYDSDVPSGATFLDPTAHTLSYIVLDGRRITPKTSSGIVKVSLPHHPYLSPRHLAGDIVRLLYHRQPGYLSPAIFAEVMWLVPQDINSVANNPWREYPELDVRCWKYREHMPSDGPTGLPPLIPVTAIRCQLARGVYDLKSPRLWLTTSLGGDAISMESLVDLGPRDNGLS